MRPWREIPALKGHDQLKRHLIEEHYCAPNSVADDSFANNDAFHEWDHQTGLVFANHVHAGPITEEDL